MAIWRSPATVVSVGQDRRILTCLGAGAPELQSGQSAGFCPDGDQAIAIYRGGCLRRSPSTVRSVGQDRQILTCLGAGAPELQSGQSAGFCPDGDQAIAIYRGVVSGDRHIQWGCRAASVGGDRLILTCSAGARGKTPARFFLVSRRGKGSPTGQTRWASFQNPHPENPRILLKFNLDF